ncbi:Crp/Fnr family transcriptional regulator [Desulfonema magnum]|uniref:Cyclic nucleotide-binding domain-containing protein n=1 Tax=Desulfonema magnum TaxID=45655 RepID=A0A975BJ27_9BACT|nr:cyclic nucleotide-binding domain-containing protein [Desulfonema magnum]QTA86237.1 cyclic nucleotide-binding domain-containing protein [Desulfonema magnum]
MISLDLLEKLDIFEGLNDDQLTAVQENCEEKEYKRGDRLFAEGEDATHLWIVTEGRVDLRFEMPGSRPTSDDYTVSAVSARDSVAKILGWSCFVPPHKMRLSGYCARDCKVIKIGKTNLTKLFAKDPWLGFLIMSYLVRVVGYRFHQFQDEAAKNMGENIMSCW